MPDRLTSLDLTFLKAESPATPMHVGTVDIFEPPVHGDEGFDYESLVALIRDRIAFVPRYRQRVQQVPGRFAGPVWVDDEEFDTTFHVRRSALPRPGTHAQLLELVARIMSRRLDRARPLWEMYLVEGLQGDRFAIIAKSHQALVDGNSTVDIGQVVLDSTAHPRETPTDTWQPAHPPSALQLLAGVFFDATKHPTAVLELVRVEIRHRVPELRTSLLARGRRDDFLELNDGLRHREVERRRLSRERANRLLLLLEANTDHSDFCRSRGHVSNGEPPVGCRGREERCAQDDDARFRDRLRRGSGGDASNDRCSLGGEGSCLEHAEADE